MSNWRKKPHFPTFFVQNMRFVVKKGELKLCCREDTMEWCIFGVNLGIFIFNNLIKWYIMSTYVVSPKRVTLQAIPSRYNLFWWEVVEMYRGEVLSSLGQFRSEESANLFIEWYVKSK